MILRFPFRRRRSKERAAWLARLLPEQRRALVRNLRELIESKAAIERQIGEGRLSESARRR